MQEILFLWNGNYVISIAYLFILLKIIQEVNGYLVIWLVLNTSQ